MPCENVLVKHQVWPELPVLDTSYRLFLLCKLGDWFLWQSSPTDAGAGEEEKVTLNSV